MAFSKFKPYKLVFILLITVLLNACNFFGASYEFSEESVIVNAINGGIVKDSSGDVHLSIPAGALNKDETIEISSEKLEDVPDEMQDLINSYGGEGYEIIRLEPSGLEFDEPVTISFEIPVEEISEDGLPSFDLIIQSESGQPEFVQDLLVEFDAETGKYIVSGKIEHFSWVVRVKSFLRVQLEQLEPKERKVGDIFEVSIKLKNLPQTDSIRFVYKDIQGTLTTYGSAAHYFHGPADNLIFNDVRLKIGETRDFKAMLECTKTGLGSYTLSVIAEEGEYFFGATKTIRLSISGVVRCVAPTATPTKTLTPTETPEPTNTPTQTQTPTQTTIPTETLTPTPTFTSTSVPSPTPTITPTPVEISGTVNVGTASCRYGPSSSFLFEFGLAQGEPVVVLGQNGGWLLVKPDFYFSPCWIWNSLLTLTGNYASLPYFGYLKIMPRDYVYSQIITGLLLSRSGSNIIMSWIAASYMNQPDLIGYFVVANVCQNGIMVQLFFKFETNSGTIPDDTNCSQTSYIVIYVIHKHGYGPELRRDLP